MIVKNKRWNKKHHSLLKERNLQLTSVSIYITQNFVQCSRILIFALIDIYL